MLLCPRVKARTSDAKARASEAKAKDLTFEAKAKNLTSEAKAKDMLAWPRGLHLWCFMVVVVLSE